MGYGPKVGIRSGFENFPVNWITWYDAIDYCMWLSSVTGRNYKLPSEAEWEKGARGVTGLIYPWGNGYSPERARNCDAGYVDPEETTVDVESYHIGASPYGLLHMSGNVQEWTSSLWGADSKTAFRYPYDPTDGREDLAADKLIGRIVRGGSFMHNKKGIRCASRNGHTPTDSAAFMGFRVVKALKDNA